MQIFEEKKHTFLKKKLVPFYAQKKEQARKKGTSQKEPGVLPSSLI